MVVLEMAGSREIIREYADATGLSPDALEYHLRYLVRAGLVPAGDRGRGRARGQYEPEHYANFLLSLAALQPSDGPVAAQTLRQAVHMPGAPDPLLVPPEPGNLGQVLEGMIRGVAKAILLHRSDQEKPSPDAWPVPTLIHLQLNPYMAKLYWHGGRNYPDGPDLPAKLLIYGYTGIGDGPAPPPRLGTLRRETQFAGELILVAARLWADTVAFRGEVPVSSSGTPGDATTSSGSGNGDPLPQGSPPTRTNRSSDAATHHANGAFDSPQNISRGRERQSIAGYSSIDLIGRMTDHVRHNRLSKHSAPAINY